MRRMNLWQYLIRETQRCLIVLLPLGMSGCFFFGGSGVYAPDAVAQTPPMTCRDAGGVFELTLQAPNPGWRVEYDGARVNREGTRLLFTVRRPDPGMQYPGRVVEKTLRTDEPATMRCRVWARVLDHGETRGKYAPTDLVLAKTPER